MSKIGRKPINISGVEIKIDGQVISYKGSNAAGKHELPYYMQAAVEGDELFISYKDSVSEKQKSEFKKFWGLHRALLSNAISGAKKDFEKRVLITGLGFKVLMSGSKLNFSLGYSHKIDMELPKEVKLEVDKTGQNLLFKSAYKDKLGLFCDQVRSLRRVEPYKGTGIRFENEIVIKKAGKTKS